MSRPVRRDDLRCGCGSLMARLREGQLELKCRRCKRVHVLKIDTAQSPDAAEIACCARGATVTIVDRS